MVSFRKQNDSRNHATASLPTFMDASIDAEGQSKMAKECKDFLEATEEVEKSLSIKKCEILSKTQGMSEEGSICQQDNSVEFKPLESRKLRRHLNARTMCQQHKHMPLTTRKQSETLTISYFGNVQDSQLGQVKAKIPLIKKNSVARTFADRSPAIFQNTRQQTEQVFFKKLGQKPYIINKYVRPKALSTFKLEPSQSESEFTFAKRQQLYMMEKEIKGQQ